MNTQNNTVVKLAETALLAALCYVSFTFLQIKIRCRAETQHPFILEMLSAYLQHCFWVAYMADLPELSEWELQISWTCLYHRRTENLCTEILYRSDRRSCGTQGCKDQ